jgi:hypothetical protein
MVKMVYEKFFGCLNQVERHLAMSLTKSFVGLLGEMLVAENKLEENKLVQGLYSGIDEKRLWRCHGASSSRYDHGPTIIVKIMPIPGVGSGNTAAWNPLPKPEGYS